jgi:natural product precursor
MKKQIKKLSLNKKTISNLNSSEMNKKVGGSYFNGGTCGSAYCPNQTKNRNTCPGHNTCYAC